MSEVPLSKDFVVHMKYCRASQRLLSPTRLACVPGVNQLSSWMDLQNEIPTDDLAWWVQGHLAHKKQFP